MKKSVNNTHITPLWPQNQQKWHIHFLRATGRSSGAKHLFPDLASLSGIWQFSTSHLPSVAGGLRPVVARVYSSAPSHGRLRHLQTYHCPLRHVLLDLLSLVPHPQNTSSKNCGTFQKRCRHCGDPNNLFSTEVLLQPTNQHRQRTIANANRPKTHDNDKAVLVFQPACLCSNSCENNDARQMRIMDHRATLHLLTRMHHCCDVSSSCRSSITLNIFLFDNVAVSHSTFPYIRAPHSWCNDPLQQRVKESRAQHSCTWVASTNRVCTPDILPIWAIIPIS